MTRTRREKQPETRAAILRFMQEVRKIEFPDESDLYDEILSYIQDKWQEEKPCDIDVYDVARAVRKLSSDKVLTVWHRHPLTDERIHRIQIATSNQE